jgi:hypothetical protein
VTAGPRAAKAKAAEVRRKRVRLVGDDVLAETEKEEGCRKRADYVLKLYLTLPEKYQKRVIGSIAEKIPIRMWLDSAEHDAA